jgi:glycosyltransferase involved in cell wall biosynthesis
MRVLLISGTSSYMKGGIPVATTKLMNELARTGNEPALLADVPLAGTETFPFFHLDYPQNQKMAEQISAAVAQYKPDVCHVVSAGVKMVDAAADVMGDRPWALTVHSIPPAERKFNRFLGRNRLHYFFRNLRFLPNTILWKRMFRGGRFTRCICHSDYVLNTAVAYGCDRAKLVNIPLGVDLPPESTPRLPRVMSLDDGPNIVTVGGIAQTKGTHDFLRVMAKLVKDFPNARYRIIGEVRDKAYLALLESMIGQLGLAKHVIIQRSASEQEKSAALDQADLYVQPSHEEGFCLAYIEAAPIVPRMLGADTGAIAAISAGLPAARVVKPMDVQSLERAARELLSQPAPADVFQKRREFLSQKYSQNGYAAAHLRLYTELAGHQPTA